MLAAISKMDDRIKAHRTQTTDKDEGKTTSLGTSKLNYLVRSCCLAPHSFVMVIPHRILDSPLCASGFVWTARELTGYAGLVQEV